MKKEQKNPEDKCSDIIARLNEFENEDRDHALISVKHILKKTVNNNIVS